MSQTTHLHNCCHISTLRREDGHSLGLNIAAIFKCKDLNRCIACSIRSSGCGIVLRPKMDLMDSVPHDDPPPC